MAYGWRNLSTPFEIYPPFNAIERRLAVVYSDHQEVGESTRLNLSGPE